MPADGLRRHNRKQSQVQRRTASSRQPAAEAGDQDRRPPRWTGPPAVTPSGQGRRPVGALMSRCRPGTRQRAARTRPQVHADRGWAAQRAGRMERRACADGAHLAQPGGDSSALMAGKTPRACGQLRARGLWRRTPRDGARPTLHAPSCAGGHSVGRSCIKIYIPRVHRCTVDLD